MIKKYTLIRVDCDYCDGYYPTKKNPIHFPDEESALKALKENGWQVGDEHICPSCFGRLCGNPDFMLFKNNKKDES